MKWFALHVNKLQEAVVDSRKDLKAKILRVFMVRIKVCEVYDHLRFTEGRTVGDIVGDLRQNCGLYNLTWEEKVGYLLTFQNWTISRDAVLEHLNVLRLHGLVSMERDRINGVKVNRYRKVWTEEN